MLCQFGCKLYIFNPLSQDFDLLGKSCNFGEESSALDHLEHSVIQGWHQKWLGLEQANVEHGHRLELLVKWVV